MKIHFLLCFFGILIYAKSMGQIIVDLSDKKNTTESIDIKKSFLIVKNILPNPTYHYSFNIEMNEEKIPSFSTSSFQSESCLDTIETKIYKKAYKEFLNATEESQLPDLQRKLAEAISKLDNKYYSCKMEGNEAIKTLTYTKDLYFSLRNNQTIVVKVIKSFTINKKDTSVTWTKTFKTPEKSPWLTHFGFTYQPNIFSRNDQFYSKADTSNANKFAITKKNGNQNRFWENLSPTIMFSYPVTNKEGDSHLAFSAIAATNFSTFSAGAGVSAIIGENVALGTGIMFTQKYVLNGIYKEGDIIKTNLTYEQLHEKKWGPEIYFTIGLRFDKNPFGTQKNTSNSNAASDNK